MRFPRIKSRVVVGLAIAALVVGGGWLAFKPSHKTSFPATGQKTGQVLTAPSSSQTGDASNLPYIETAEFKYVQPANWVQMSQKVLDVSGASSGIARPTAPAATFSIKVSAAIPKDNDDLKNSTLNELKKFSHFALITSADTKVDGKNGQKFIYSFSDTSGQNKVIQYMSVVVNKNKTFFLLFSSAAGDYDKQAGDFASILSSFHFK